MFDHFSIPGNNEYKEKNYDRIRGQDSWIGRSVKKYFEGHGFFTGTIDAVDDDEENNGHRVFHVVYEDGDDAWVEVDEIVQILQPPAAETATIMDPETVTVSIRAHVIIVL